MSLQSVTERHTAYAVVIKYSIFPLQESDRSLVLPVLDPTQARTIRDFPRFPVSEDEEEDES